MSSGEKEISMFQHGLKAAFFTKRPAEVQHPKDASLGGFCSLPGLQAMFFSHWTTRVLSRRAPLEVFCGSYFLNLKTSR